MHRTKKLTLAAVAAVALLIGLATPAAAGGPYPLEVTGGTLNTVLGTFDLTPGSQGTPPCPEKASTLALRTDNDASPAGANRWSVGGTFSGQFRLGTPPAGPWYQADFTVVANGTYAANPTPPPDYFLTGTVTVQVRIYELNPATCLKDTLKCIIAGRFVITSGEFNGTLPNSAVGDTAVLDGSTGVPGGLALVTSSCSAPFVAANGSNATLVDLTMEHV